MAKLIKMIYGIMMIGIMSILLFIDTSVKYTTSEYITIVENKLRNIFCVFIIFLCFYVIKKCKKKFHYSKVLNNNYKEILIAGTVILFLIQLIIIKYAYFYAGWDCRIVTLAAEGITKNNFDNSMQIFMNQYYSMNPNNVMITFIFSWIMKIAYFFGVKNGYLVLIIIGTIIVDLTAFLVAGVVHFLTNEKKYGIFAWAIYVAFIGLSPWILVPYTDVYTIIFPIVIVALYLWTQNSKKVKSKWLAIGLITGVGATIKPTVMIPLIAIVIVQSEDLISRKQIKQGLMICFMLCIGFAISLGVKEIAKNKIENRIEIEEEKSMSMTHYMMMGLNTTHTGSFLKEDRDFSNSYKNRKDRKEANIKEIKERLKEFGVLGYAKFLVKKTLVNYNSGSMAWGVEGNFIFQESNVEKTPITLFLRNILYAKGDFFEVFASWMQIIWIFVLTTGILSLVKVPFAHEKVENGFKVMWLTIIGITAFTLIFEARARYLYVMTPIYIVIACSGLYNYSRRLMIKSRPGENK